MFSFINIPAQTGEKRIEHLSDLAKIWGAVKYFHPYPAYREIDLDKALVEAVPKVNAAKSPEEYAAAIDSMLAALADKQTHSFVKKPITKNDSTVAANGKEPLRLENGVSYYGAPTAAKLSSQSVRKSDEFTGKFLELFQQAKSIGIDLRVGDKIADGTLFELDYVMRQILPPILDKKVPLGTIRYRIHNGYAPQNGATSGGYYSGMITDTPETFSDDGEKPFKTPTVANYSASAFNRPSKSRQQFAESSKAKTKF